MAYDYSALPTAANVYELITASNIAPTLTVGSDLATAIIQSNSHMLTMQTSRQFVPGSPGEIRYFDGSGTGILNIDEYVTITAVQFFYLPSISTVSLDNFVQVSQQPWGKDKLQILQGQANMPNGWWLRFPEGRANVAVTGTWGYGATIPKDVWLAILQKSASDIVQANSLSAQGQLKNWTDGDAEESYSNMLLGESAGWIGKGSLWEQVQKVYRRSLKSHLQKSTPKVY